jgi:hypothetical protein
MRHTFFLLWAVLLTALLLPAQTAQRKVTLNWDHPDANVTFNAYISPGDCLTTPTFVKHNTAPITAKTYEITGLAEGTYCFAVRAERDTLESGNSNLASAVVGPPPVVPGAPTGLSLSVSVTVTVNP